MNFDINKLPYRNNVAAIIFKKNKYLLIQRIDWPSDQWKFPQGGVEEQESEKEAIERELIEEIGTNKFKIIGKSFYSNKYDWNDYSIEKSGFKWRGQYQKFFFIEFLGDDKDLNIEKKEIKKYIWVDKESLKDYIDNSDKNFKNYFVTVSKVLNEFESK